MRFLSQHFGRHAVLLPSWAALDEEALRLGSALEHVDRQGNLDDFSGTQSEKLALMRTANRRGLVSWNSTASRYDLTSLGRQQLLPPGTGGYAPPVSAGARGTTRIRPAPPFALNALIVSATCVALGVTATMLTLGTHEVAPKGTTAGAGGPIEPNPGAQVATPSIGMRQSATTTPRMPAEELKSSPREFTPAEKSVLERSHTEPATQAPAGNPDSRNAAIETGFARVPEQSPAGRAQQLEEGGPPTPNPPSGHTIAAGSKPIGWKRRHAADRQEQPARSSARIEQRPAQSQFGTEAQTFEKQKRNSSGGMQGWASGKMVNVSRKGQLVREERKLADGTVLVRYQYGNGPPHYERRPKGTRGQTLGYSGMAQETRSLDGLFR